MKLYKTLDGFFAETEKGFYRLPLTDWDALINRDDLLPYLRQLLEKIPVEACVAAPPLASLLPPIGTQEVWGAGVTFFSSRWEENKESENNPNPYQRVYHATRPHLFFKAPSYRVVGSGQQVHIRRDCPRSFPEPELTLVITRSGKIVAYTIGNDMSAGSIEAENPLYLAQAKIHDGSTGLGPCLLVAEGPLRLETKINLTVMRNEKEVFHGMAEWGKMRRPLDSLIDYLFRETTFPAGAMLMTGAGISLPPEFALHPGDRLLMSIDGIGTLVNTVSQRPR